jgi:23S rRNA pseudouridine2457 synthase
MPDILLFNKPFQVLCQFSAEGDKQTLAHYIKQPDYYPAGRLDYDSEGLLLLTNNGKLQQLISDPVWKLPKTYWVQVEGAITEDALSQLSEGVTLNDGRTLPCKAHKIDPPLIDERTPPIRYRANIPTSWIELALKEGKNRQVRRMTAHVGFPTLRLFRAAIGPWQINTIHVGECHRITLSESDIRDLWPNYHPQTRTQAQPRHTSIVKRDSRPRKP